MISFLIGDHLNGEMVTCDWSYVVDYGVHCPSGQTKLAKLVFAASLLRRYKLTKNKDFCQDIVTYWSNIST